MKLERVEENGKVIYKGVLIEKDHALAAMDLSYMKERGFVEWNHQGSRSTNHILGEPEAVYHLDKLLYADIRIYDDQEILTRKGISRDQLFKIVEASVPSVAGKVLARNEDGSIKEFMLTSISLGPNNVDPTIDKISVQMKYEQH
jgi:hypothetical protein